VSYPKIREFATTAVNYPLTFQDVWFEIACSGIEH